MRPLTHPSHTIHKTMKKILLIALFAAMPLMAQERPDMPEFPGKFDKMARPVGPRPELSEAQRAEMKARFEARKGEFPKRGPKEGGFDKKGGRRGEGKGFGPQGPKGPRGERGPRPGAEKH